MTCLRKWEVKIYKALFLEFRIRVSTFSLFIQPSLGTDLFPINELSGTIENAPCSFVWIIGRKIIVAGKVYA